MTIMAFEFLSYRRFDSRDITERIYDRLVQEFGKEAVFRDIYSIELEVDFRTFRIYPDSLNFLQITYSIHT